MANLKLRIIFHNHWTREKYINAYPKFKLMRITFQVILTTAHKTLMNKEVSMSKQIKKFHTYSISGDQHGESASHMWSTKAGKIQFVDWNSQKENELNKKKYFQGVVPSDINVIQSKLIKYVDNGNADKLTTLLKTDFIYPGCINYFRSNSNRSSGDWADGHTEEYAVRPVVEILFQEHPNFLKHLIETLIKKNDESLFKAFEETIHLDARPKLFGLTEQTKHAAIYQLETLNKYVQSYDWDVDPDGLQKKNIASSICNMLVDKINRACPSDDMYATKFTTLKLKLAVVTELHSYDNLFAIHRGYKRVLTNLATILFTLGLANIINRATTGNWLFFNKTNTQKIIEKVDHAIDFIHDQSEIVSPSPSHS